MRHAFAVLALSLLAFGQPQKFTRIIVVVQENRTPDNLFSDCAIPGADLVRPSRSSHLAGGVDLAHNHLAFTMDRFSFPRASQVHVPASDVPDYCYWASQFAFANRMFQTNQGPSAPAHQFIFGGTSQPTDTSDLFEADNPGSILSGCLYPTVMVKMIDPSGNESSTQPACFDHSSIADLLDAAGISWLYYAVSNSGLWNAPAALSKICEAAKGDPVDSAVQTCQGADWQKVILNSPQILADAANCQLAQVSWVTPAGAYSDHASQNNGSGPAWVSSIIDAIGSSSCGYWQNTAVVVLWDDWGGFYDHVAPPGGYPGAEQYTYGFRVPLLFISAHTPAMTDFGQHDFGSVLKFIETNFGLGLIGPGTFADAFADDLSVYTQGGYRDFPAYPTKERVWETTGDPDTD